MDEVLFIKLLSDHRQEVKGDTKEAILNNNSIIHANMINEIDRVDHKVDLLAKDVKGIVAHQEWQNGMLSDHDCAMKEMWFFRWVGNHPKISALILMAMIIGGAWGYHNLNIKKIIEQSTPIEFNEAATE